MSQSTTIISRGAKPAAILVVAGLALYFSLTVLSSLFAGVFASHNDGILELDGDVADSAPGAPYDWAVLCSAGMTANATQAPVDVVSCTADHVTPDRSYFDSDKDIEDVNQWGCKSINNPTPKDEIFNAYAALGTSPGDGHKILYVGFERKTNNGNSFMGFWFLQDPAACSSPGAFTGQHSFGDLLVLSDFTGGGKASSVKVYRWNPATQQSTNPLELLGSGLDCADAAFSDDVCGRVNSSALTTPWAPGSSSPLGTNQFFEAGIDLTAEYGSAGVPCFSTFIAETRSSQETTATLKDFSRGDFFTCGTIVIRKDAQPDDAQDFTYSTTGGLSPSAFSLDDDTDATLANVRSFQNVQSGSYSVTEGALPAAWRLANLSCTTNGPGTSVQISGATVNITLGLRGHVDCTYTNVKRGRIIVDKVTNPAGDPTSFNFDATGYADFALTDAAAPNNSGFLDAGTYSVEELTPAGWTLTSLSCVKSNGSTITIAGAKATINLAGGDTVICTFVNTQLYKLIVITCDTSTEALVDSTVTLSSTSTATIAGVPAHLAAKGVTQADLCATGGASYDNLPAGNYAPNVELPDKAPLFP